MFALTTPFEAGVDAEVAQGHAIVAAADDARVPHLVFSSVAGADQHTGPRDKARSTSAAALGGSSSCSPSASARGATS